MKTPSFPMQHRPVAGRIAVLGITLVTLLAAGCGGSPTSTTEHGTSADHARHRHFSSPERYAAAWNDPARDAWQRPDEIVAALGLSEGDSVADLGAGTGYLIPPLRAAVGERGRVLALDVEPAMIRYLDGRVADEGWANVEVVRSAYDDPALPPSSIDAMVTLNTWHHVTERTAFAERILASLNEGGRFVVVDYITEPTEGGGPPMAIRLDPAQVVAELEAAGFSATVIEETLPRHYIVVARREAPAASPR